MSTHLRVGTRLRQGTCLAVVLALFGAALVALPSQAADACTGNAIVCENQLPGTPANVWDVDGAGDQSIQGFATQTSVNAGTSAQFKINTNARAYSIKIYRLGYYGGNGAREVATVQPSAALPQTQPSCATDAATEIYDCGTWSVSASWAVPADAVSGFYIARLIRTDTGGDSHIPFIVRRDGNTSKVLMQASDTTWQAYNNFGGSDFYHGKSNGRAYKLSFNRPYSTRGTVNGRDYLFSNEYPMLRFLEQNGYDVSYVSGSDVSVDPALLPKHKVFVSVGHDEYWTKEQRKNVTDARDAGVNLAFFGGNDVYWKSRWEASQDGRNTPNRTLVTYKDTWEGTPLDPVEPTATWRDPRFGDLGFGYGPENALTGTQFQANSVDLALQVGAEQGRLRMWRDTSLTSMTAGSTATLSDHTLGYESNEDVDNGHRPGGLVQLSTTTGPVPEYLTDYGTTVVRGTTTHHLTLYRAASGALVFSAGTIQWAWGLDPNHDGTPTPADPRMRQATANLLVDMGAEPATLAADLTAPTASTDTTPPTATVTAPESGTTIAQGSLVTVTGTAVDTGGVVAGVEVSIDGGASWHPADGTSSWTYSGILTGNGPGGVQVRATDDSARTQTSPTKIAVDSPCPCSIFGVARPRLEDANDGSGVTLGAKFTSSANGFITGVRFYKSTANTGSHTGTLYAASGSVLATGTFANESASGWQVLNFPAPVPVTAGSTYIAAYYAPNGHYSADQNYFATNHNAGTLTALGGTGVTNGVFTEGRGFPASSYKQTNYYVDPMYSTTDTSPVILTSTAPSAGATSVATTTSIGATFSKPVAAESVSFQVLDGTGTAVPGSVAYDAPTSRATFNPTQGLATGTTYTATVNAQNLAAPAQWTFTTAAADGAPNVCPCSLFNDSDQPSTGPDSETARVQLGMAFTVSAPGQISGVRFFKNPDNQGPHPVALWSGSNKLAEATPVSETASGWQQASFDSPVPVSSGTVYTVSYTAPEGRYSSAAGGLSAKITKGPLASVANGGRYSYGTGALTSTSAANYFVDPVYSPAPAAAPVLRSVSPGDQAKSVAVTAHVQATFSTDIQPGSAMVTVKRASDNSDVPGQTSGESQGSVATFVPTNDLDPGTTYSVSVSGARNLSGTPMTSTSTSTFTTSGAAGCPCSLFETTTQPGQSDSNDGAAVTLGTKFTASVNGFVKGLRYYRDAANTGNHTGALYTSTGTKLADLTFATSGTGWQSATFSSAVPVTAGTTYVAAYYAPDGHYSADLNYFAQPVVNTPLASVNPGSVYVYGDGFPTETYMNTNYYVDVVFTTTDDDPPSVTTVVPAAGATSVPVDTAVVATFNRDITPGSLVLTVTDPAGQLVGGQLDYDLGARQATFTTAAPLAGDATYTVQVEASSASGVAMTSPRTWTFTTTDGQPATVATISPEDGTADVAGNTKPTATFSKPITASTLAMTVKSASGTSVAGSTTFDATTRTATFTPSAALANYTGYVATVTAANASGVPMPAPRTWSFTTADTIAPTVTSVSPTSNATAVPTGASASATFARAIDATSLTFTLKDPAGAVVPGTLSYTASSRVASFTPSTPLASLTRYTAAVTAKNPSGVALASPRTWAFTTADADPPSVTTTGPASGATGVATTTRVTATFARSIATGSQSVTLTNAAGVKVNGTTTYSTTSRTVTFTPSSPLTSSTLYTASVTARSAAGVVMPAPKTWSFTTAAQAYSLYTTAQRPATTVTTTIPTTVGVQFQSTRTGQVTAIRYYASSVNTGKTVTLWSADGRVLGTATTTQTATGWRTATFTTPVPLAADTSYVASVYAPVGRWSTTAGSFGSAYSSGPLTVPASGGRSGAGTGFPTTTSTTNFWVDVLTLI